MKKLFLVMLATAGLALTSCERSFEGDLATAGNEAKVSVNLAFPTIQTRAYSDGTTATHLQYAVFEKKNDVLTRLETYTELNDEINISKQIDFQLVTGRTYQFVFWAAAPSEEGVWTNPYTVSFKEDGATMTADYTGAVANDERYDAFFASVEKTITGDVQMSVELTRPFAQINVGTSDYDIASELEAAPNKSALVVKSAYTKLNLVTGAVDSDSKEAITFNYATIPGADGTEEEAFPIQGYDYLAMAYILVDKEKEVLASVQLKYAKGNDETDKTIGSVPVQRNHRTNMFGQVLTSNASLNIIIVPEYEEPDHNYSQLLFAAAVGGTAVLDDDVDLNEHGNVLTFTRDAVIDLNGKTIKSPEGKDGAITVLGANLTITGNGTMEATDDDHCTLIWADNGGTVTIENGTFTADGNDDQLIYIGQNGGTINIKGGTFRINDDSNFTLNCYDPAFRNGSAKFVVTGGTFYNFDPSHSTADFLVGETFVNWVAPGYKSVKTTIDGEDWYIVVPDDTDIISVPTDMSQDDFNEAITNAADNAIFYLGDNVELKLPSKAVDNKNFTFVGNGADKSTIKDLNHETATGSNLTFENLTLQVAKGGSATSLGFNGAESVTLKNVTVKGEFHTFSAKNAVFEGCYFVHDGINTTDRQGIWCEAYGKTVIKDCIFEVIPPNQNGNETKAILIYSDYNTDMGDVEVTNCTFRKGVTSAKACVEIHSEKFTSAGTVTITGCTYDAETYEGGLWREIYNVNGPTLQKGDKTQFYTVIVDGVEVQKSAK